MLKRRQQCEEQRVTCSSLETALQASKVQDDLLASQLRAAQHLLHCEQLETQALSQQVCPPAADWYLALHHRIVGASFLHSLSS